VDRKELFVKTIDDLSNKIKSNNEYEVLKASGLLRALVLDGKNSLAIIVNREFREKLEFKYADHTKGSAAFMLARNPTSWSVLDGFHSGNPPPATFYKLSGLDGLLSEVVLLKDGKKFTVKDVILFTANITGGVHSGTPKENDDKERILHELQLWLGGLPITLKQIESISKVIIDGLESIYIKSKN
jgi:hypothetical protein